VTISHTSLHWRGAILCAAVVLAALAFAQSGAGRSLLRDAGVAGAPERYTELSFARPSKLPGKLLPGQRRVSLSYVLHNVEGERRDYRWTVAAGGTRLAHGTTSAAPGERVVIRRTVTVPCRGARTRVEVRLARPSQAIGFWAACR
jgi:hypothetical protein